ncbi:MAG: hypothetical protein NVS1B12_11640 [Acidimicrobiales bacterium]
MKRTERGQAGGVEAVAFGLLILVGGILLISNAWAVVDAKLAAGTSAREAARTFAKAPTTDPVLAAAKAEQAARDTLTQLGWRLRDVSITSAGPGFQRCAPVTYAVSIPVRSFRLPFLPLGPRRFEVTARHTERVDPYRSGVPGTGPAPCG